MKTLKVELFGGNDNFETEFLDYKYDTWDSKESYLVGGENMIYKTTYNDKWKIREFNDDGQVIYHEDSDGNYWSKKETPDIPYPY